MPASLALRFGRRYVFARLDDDDTIVRQKNTNAGLHDLAKSATTQDARQRHSPTCERPQAGAINRRCVTSFQ